MFLLLMLIRKQQQEQNRKRDNKNYRKDNPWWKIVVGKVFLLTLRTLTEIYDKTLIVEQNSFPPFSKANVKITNTLKF